MGMMKMIANVGRKFRTAYMKTARPKTGPVKPLGDAYNVPNGPKRQRDLIRSRGVSDFPQEVNIADQKLGNTYKKHIKANDQRTSAKVAKRQADYDADYPKSRATRGSGKPKRVTFKGQDMQERNFVKSYTTKGGYKYGTFVSKEALRTGGPKAVADSYGRKGFSNYKTRVYQP
jgi:hypothetical protein